MKTTMKLLTLLAVLVFATQLTAQFSVGIKAGTNWNSVNTSNGLDAVAPNFKTINHWQIGAVAEYALTDQFALVGELNYLKKGFGLAQGLDTELFGVNVPLGVNAESTFSYIEVPLLAKYNFTSGPVSAYVTGGPTLGYATGGKIITRAQVILTDLKLGETPINLDAINYQRMELGMAVGGGVEFAAGAVDLFIDGRYSRGFTQLYDIPIVEERIRNHGFALTAGVMVPL